MGGSWREGEQIEYFVCSFHVVRSDVLILIGVACGGGIIS
jgi:hypothetical protein